MSRVFVQEAFNTQISGNAMLHTSPKFNDLLGRADVLQVQTYVSGVTGTSPTITVKVQGTNDGIHWFELETLENAVSIAAPPYISVKETTKFLCGAVRLEISLGGSDPTANVILAVCGRTS